MEKITVREYRPDDRREWEDFVAASNNGTMFHTQTFLDYHPKGRFDFYHLMFRRGSKLVGVLPGGLTGGGEVFWSPIGASYGSIVTGDVSFRTALDIVDSFMDFCRGKKIREIFLIPQPIIYSGNFSQNLDYALLYRRFDFDLHYISHSIELKHGVDFLKYFDKTARKTIRKILREGKLTIKESNDYAAFNNILIENKARYKVSPTHSLRDMLRLKELMPGSVRLSLVYLDDVPIAGSWLFLTNKKVVLCFYNMLLYEYERYRPVYLLMYDAVRWAVENGCEWVDIGVSQDTAAEDKMTPSMNLIYFKERFDSRGILRSTYHYKFRD